MARSKTGLNLWAFAIQKSGAVFALTDRMQTLVWSRHGLERDEIPTIGNIGYLYDKQRLEHRLVVAFTWWM